MSVNVCPIKAVNATVEGVWRLLSEPASYALWWDAETRSIVPEGPARKGQRIYAQSKALGKRWDVYIDVDGVDEDGRQIDLTTRLPLGITVRNHLSCSHLDSASSRVVFG